MAIILHWDDDGKGKSVVKVAGDNLRIAQFVVAEGMDNDPGIHAALDSVANMSRAANDPDRYRRKRR